MTLAIVIGFIALTLFIVGFFKEDLVLWVIDTLLWFVWSYLIYNIASATPITGNSYIPTAVTLLGAGLVLVCIYKDFSIIISSMRARRSSPGPTYDEDVQRLRDQIRNRTRRH
jgi:hypothetical protein